MADEDFNDDELAFLSILSEHGDTCGNITLRRALRWSQTRYDDVRDGLVEKGVIGIGKGQGGSVWLVESYVEALILCLPSDGSFMTRGVALKRTGWPEERFLLVANGLIEAGLARRGPRNNLALILTPELEEVLLERVLNGNVTEPFDAVRVAAQLGWEVNRVYEVRARVIQREHKAKPQRKARRASSSSGASSMPAESRRSGVQPGREAPMKAEPRPVEVFVAYARADSELRERLDIHFSTLRRNGRIRNWSDEQILPGQELARTIREKLDRADIVLLLLSPEFLEGYGAEIERALERHEAGDAVVVPVILRWCHWEATALHKLSPLPVDRVPIKACSDQDKAFYDVVRGIDTIVQGRSGR